MENPLQGNVNKYYTFELLIHFVFYTPVFVIFLLSKNLSLTQITLIFSIHSLGALIFDLPGGVFADYFTKKLSLIVGSVLWGLSLLSYAFIGYFWQFCLAAFIGGIGQGFLSGADRALIHETLRLLGRETEYKKVEGRVRGINEIVAGAGVLLGGFIGAISLPLTLIASAASVGLSAACSLFFKNPPKDKESTSSPAREILSTSVGILKNNRQVLWLTLYLAVFVAFVWATNILSQPYLKSINVPTAYFGLIFSGFSIFYALSSIYAHKLDRYITKKFFLLFASIVPLTLILIGTIPGIIAFLSWVFLGIFETANWTLVSSEILRIVPKHQSTTILSFQSLTLRLINITISPLVGISADRFGIYRTLQLNGVALLAALAALAFASVKMADFKNVDKKSAGDPEPIPTR
ncbi:MAG: MFS transporter [Deltaproteobacteria bacterium]|nr:MFS transporter [Deltaproteobacteria bacterium]